jgi:hypothetical protein
MVYFASLMHRSCTLLLSGKVLLDDGQKFLAGRNLSDMSSEEPGTVLALVIVARWESAGIGVAVERA